MGVRIEFADLGNIGQIKGAVKRRQRLFAADCKHGALGAELPAEID